MGMAVRQAVTRSGSFEGISHPGLKNNDPEPPRGADVAGRAHGAASDQLPTKYKPRSHALPAQRFFVYGDVPRHRHWNLLTDQPN
jgi:hypothetical protein